AAVLQAERSLALLGALTDERRARLLAHAGAPDRGADARLAVAAAHDTTRAVGLPDPTRADAPASVVVVPQADGRFRVTFVFTSPRRPKQALLHGSWDQWTEPGVALRERSDGTFTATLVLPAGRHEYKVRLGVGGVWEHDAGNPLTAADGMGGINSVLLLE
ncbi:MAG: glycogen-binding domain-containing protein, partial [Planctomycetes bacterium]|nr:glycogen-binding domain-containing protein [Planctomycetota bacterium]